MYACVCFSVTEEEVQDEVLSGARTERELGERCGAGTSCGTCVERLGCLIETALRDRSAAAKLAACPVPCAPAQRLHGGAPCPALASSVARSAEVRG
jgi:bacterioferritin-associated ferredoxin